MLKAGMVVAVEIAALNRKYGSPDEIVEHKGFRAMIFRTGTYDLYVVHSGAGEIAAAAATQFLISEFDVDVILNFGVVGGLTSDMAISRACIVERIVHYDFDCSAIDGTVPGRYLNYPDVYIPVNEELFRKARAIHPELRPVTCASGDKFVEGYAAKNALHEQFQADICEMECAGIVITADRSGIPSLFIKMVSDSVNGGAEEFTKALDETSSACLDILDRIIRTL
ncbi:MAG: 5'-methylthioadenosine/S-adenosylhomocysteine nucleosidase [Solobacterium sp.]|nr:5'-methylthioadenosine/S-adenosylhomocysteine nucleosidase [Solobacterium sp.]